MSEQWGARHNPLLGRLAPVVPGSVSLGVIRSRLPALPREAQGPVHPALDGAPPCRRRAAWTPSQTPDPRCDCNVREPPRDPAGGRHPGPCTRPLTRPPEPEDARWTEGGLTHASHGTQNDPAYRAWRGRSHVRARTDSCGRSRRPQAPRPSHRRALARQPATATGCRAPPTAMRMQRVGWSLSDGPGSRCRKVGSGLPSWPPGTGAGGRRGCVRSAAGVWTIE